MPTTNLQDQSFQQCFLCEREKAESYFAHGDVMHQIMQQVNDIRTGDITEIDVSNQALRGTYIFNCLCCGFFGISFPTILNSTREAFIKEIFQHFSKSDKRRLSGYFRNRYEALRKNPENEFAFFRLNLR